MAKLTDPQVAVAVTAALRAIGVNAVSKPSATKQQVKVNGEAPEGTTAEPLRKRVRKST